MGEKLIIISTGSLFLKRHEGRSERTLLSLLSALTNFLFVSSQNMVQGVLVVVVLGVGVLGGGGVAGGVYGACNPCPWGLKRTGGASMELISNSMELWKSENATKDFFGQLAFNVTKHTLPPATRRQLHKSSIRIDDEGYDDHHHLQSNMMTMIRMSMVIWSNTVIQKGSKSLKSTAQNCDVRPILYSCFFCHWFWWFFFGWVLNVFL